MGESSSNRNIRIEKSAVGSAIVSGDGNTIYVIHQTGQVEADTSGTDKSTKKDSPISANEIGPNPYKGLAAFQAVDAKNYFGRETQIERLWQRLQSLYEQSGQTVPRFLPILGPSGSGKSSLVRAGLIPALAKRSLPGKEQLRVVVMMPGTQPLEALAGLLAKVATQDPLPVEKAQEFERVLRRKNNAGIYDGLRRIATMIPDIREIPLVVIVDQLEEVFSLCKEREQRQIFMATLLEASSDPTGNVSVVATLRSDFWGETQKYEGLNQIVGSDRSVNVPAMTVAELRRAIAQPAIQAGHPFDEATIDLLVSDAEGREGALPLLQFALSRLWEGLREGKTPAETYREMGGVGGALASKAQDIYAGLSAEDQKIARRVFIGLVQLGEGVRDTRRRTLIENLATSRDSSAAVRQVIGRFSSPSARLISLSNEAEKETAEVTHEALFDHWQLLNDWLDSSREDIRFQRRLEEDAIYWDEQDRPDGLLWRSPDLDLLRNFGSRAEEDLSPLSAAFYKASDLAEKRDKGRKRLLLTTLVTALFSAIALSIFSGYKVHQAARRQMELYEARAKDLADSNELESLSNGLAAIGLGRSAFVKFPSPFGPPMISTGLLDRPNRSMQASAITFIPSILTDLELSANGETIAGFLLDSKQSRVTLQVWNKEGNLIQAEQPYQALRGSSAPVLKISSDGQTIAIHEKCKGQIHLLDKYSVPITEPLKTETVAIKPGTESTNEESCRRWPFAISGNGETIASSVGSKILVWKRQRNEISQSSIESPSPTVSLAMSEDGKTIVSNGIDRKIRLWDETGNLINQPFSTERVGAMAISEDGQTIASIHTGNTVKLWDKQGKQIGDPLAGHSVPIKQIAFGKAGETIIARGFNDSTTVWDRTGEILDKINRRSTLITPDRKTKVSLVERNSLFGSTLLIQRDAVDMIPQLIEGENGQMLSVDISSDAETVATASSDGFIRLFDRKGEETKRFRPSSSAREVPFFDLSEDGETIFHTDSSDRTITNTRTTGQNEASYPARRLVTRNRQGNIVGNSLDQKPLPFDEPVISADQQTIVGIDRTNTVHIWDAQGEDVVQPFPLDAEAEFSYGEDISADGNIIAVALSIGGQDFIQAISRQGAFLNERLSLDPNQPIVTIAVSADGKTIATTKELTYTNNVAYQTIVLLSPDGDRETIEIKVPGTISELALSADGETIVTGDFQGVIRKWDRAGNAIDEPFEGHKGVIRELVISTDGKMIVSSGEDYTVRLWPTSQLSEGWLAYTCDRLKNYLSERSQLDDVAKEAQRTCDRHT